MIAYGGHASYAGWCLQGRSPAYADALQDESEAFKNVLRLIQEKE